MAFFRCLVALAAAASRSSCVTGLAENMKFLEGHQARRGEVVIMEIPAPYPLFGLRTLHQWSALGAQRPPPDILPHNTDRILETRDLVWKWRHRGGVSPGHQNEHDVLTNCCSFTAVCKYTGLKYTVHNNQTI